ncbi:MAG: HesA/MoeB/ThiF family protein [Rickettsiales bacterium]
MDLSLDWQRRYARHIVLSEIGKGGQERLGQARILVIGAGGLGSSAIAYLAAAGVGKIGVIDPDRVEISNLQRQILFESADIGRSKVFAARDRAQEVNSDCLVEVFEDSIDDKNAAGIIHNFDIVIDGSDNFATRFLVSKACFLEKKILISAAISGFSAQISTFKPYLGKEHPCYNCLIPEIPERELSCAQEGIIGPLAGMLGSMQALEAIKEYLEIGQGLSGFLIIIDSLTMNIRKVTLAKDKDCRLCG